jgi:outer membrane protein insertion porin family
MKKLVLGFLFLGLPLLSFGQELIEKIDIIGNERVTREAIMFYLSSREGDYYSEDLLQKDFRALWSTGFFADIRFEEEQGTKGKIVKIYLEENPVIRTISYKTGKKLKEDDIVNKLKEKDEFILPNSCYSPYKLGRIKSTIEDMLIEKGLHAGKVDMQTTKQGKSEVDVLFRIEEGPKVRVGEVEFVGKPKLPQSILREAMKENRQHNIFTWIAGKDVYKQSKLEDDLTAIKKKLQENGYMEATVGEPKVEEIKKRTMFPFFKKQTMMKIIIPVNAGYLYRVGEVKVEGNKFFSLKGIEDKIKFKKGEVYSTKVREKSVEDIGEMFRDYGHWYGQVIPVENLDPKNKLVNITYNINEGETCFLRRLEFKGNVFTKDKVIRREMLLPEGAMFSLAMFKDSLLRIKQLGLVDVEKDPDIRPDEKQPNQFDVTVNVKELQRNNIQFTAGYSGYEGTFIAVSYQTVNFLGAGENLELTAQYGKYVKNYVFGFTEPYFLDLPFSVGINVYDRYNVYIYLYNQKSRGIDLNLGGRLPGWWRANLVYSFQYLDVTLPDTQLQTTEVTDSSGETSTVTASYIDPYYLSMYGLGHYYMSSVTPSIYRSTIDSPLTPSSGTMYLASLMYAGTFLGGEIHLIKPRFEFTHYQPIVQGQQSLGFHIEYSYIKSLRNSPVPFWERFFLGGERNIRGYDIYSIGPRSPATATDPYGTNIGGEKELVLNFEYIVHVGGAASPLYLIAFHDRGNALAPDQKISFTDVYTSTGLEARIFVPALRVPFRLIFSYNNRRIYSSDSNFTFRFAIGTTF